MFVGLTFSKIPDYIVKNQFKLVATAAVVFYNMAPDQNKKIECYVPFEQNCWKFAFCSIPVPEYKK